jgi:hypothetical protein
MSSVGNEYLVVTGGLNENKVLGVCEVYDIDSNRWSDLPPLQISRYHHTTCTINKQWLYLFCGKKYPNIAISDIERLDLTNISAWEIIKMQFFATYLPPRYNCGAVQINE